MHKSDDSNFAGRLVQRLGENSCLIDAATGESLCGRDLTRWIVSFAAGLKSLGLQSGERLLISCDLSPASTVACLGSMYAGLVPIPADERTLSSSAEWLLGKAQAKALWTARGVPSSWGGSGQVRQIQGLFDTHSSYSLPPTPCSDHDIASLMPTSGSTGAPRLVMVSHGNLRSNTEAIIRSQHLGADERAMLVMPVSYCFGASVMQTHLYQGGGVVFDSRFMFPDKVLHAMNDYHCTTFAGVPAVYNILLRRSNLRSIPLPDLRRFLQAGGALAPESIQHIRKMVPTADFFVMYGQTEATARISCLPAERLADKLGSAGLPLDNLQVRIVDDESQELPKGRTGEIQVRGPSVCSGYLDEPESSALKFRQGWLKTGDFGCCDDEGYLWIKGRSDEFIKICGRRVGIRDAEARVAAVPGVHECAAVGVPHAEAGEALAVFIVADKSVATLAEDVRRALPSQWICASVKILDELPRTTSGKVARYQLQRLT